ncbi:uncharacterized protein LOC143259619 isoform X2 [Megalopta genalis]|uniref:uncharacterized protein LOC143259619 isoform X2 n=1 Tax=Megalopta genalis TaxID=115081 RepID=UPI003FD08C98
MTDISDHHKLIKVLLSTVGLWPYDNTWFIYLKRAVASFIHNADYTLNVIVAFITHIIFVIIFIFKYTSFLYKMKILRKLFDTTIYHRSTITDENERNIIFQSIAYTNVMTSLFAGSIYIGSFGFMFYQFLPSGYEKSADRVEFYYFTDNSKFDYITFLYFPIFVMLGLTGLIGPEVVTQIFCQHGRTLFQIVCFRIKTAFIQPSGISDFEKSKSVADKLISATKLHKETMKFAKQATNCLTTSYSILMLLGTISLTLNLLRISQSLRGQWKFGEILVQMVVLSVHIVYLCMANYVGQIVTDSSSNVFTELHNSRWYTAPVRTQKLLLFFTLNCTKTYTVLLLGLYTVNLGRFSAVIRHHLYLYSSALIFAFGMILLNYFSFAACQGVFLLFHSYVFYADMTNLRHLKVS